MSWTGTQPPDPSPYDNGLGDVTVLSSCNVWAVGSYQTGPEDSPYQTLIEHWNGSAWKQVASPNPGGLSNENALGGVRAVSASNIWAVGSYSNGTATRTLIEHWNGSMWAQVPSPSPSFSSLGGVAATSSSNAWAVGRYYNGTAYQTLIEHWNGSAWKRVPSPNPGGSSHNNRLTSVTATASNNAWAVGSYSNGTAYQTLIEHWNGSAWKRVPSPNPAGSSRPNPLTGVRATSSSNAWAVGWYSSGTAYQTLIEHWNGTAWKQVASPNPGRYSFLYGVAATSSSSAWAVGRYDNGTGYHTLIEHWDGTAWRQVPSPNLSSFSNILVGVGASAATNVWAVGAYAVTDATDSTVGETLALHCC